MGQPMGQQGSLGGQSQGMQPGMSQGLGQSVGRQRTGTSDPTYDLISVLYHCLESASTCEQYIQDAQGDQELAQFFQQCLQQNKQAADKAKQLLARRLSSTGSGH